MTIQSTLDQMREWIEKNKSQWMEDYSTFLKFPSISSEPEHKKDTLDCCNWVCNYLKQLYFEIEVWPTSGHPVIFASHMQAGPNAPTLLIYNHYDVQPVDPLSEWETPPFQPSLREGNIYARGAQDNKGQCFYVIQSLKLLQDLMGSFPINIKLCIEGEEEIGSAGLSLLLDEKKEKLQADYLAIVDVGLRKADAPSLTLGLRGMVTFDVELKGSKIDLHSGSHGGVVYNPIHALVKLLGNLHDEEGKIAIPGFYEDVAELSEEERSRISFSFNPQEYKEQTGALPTGGEIKYSPLERAWIRPTIEINGIYGGYTGSGFKTVIPAKASAKISCRLVPYQQPEKIAKLVASHLKNNAPPGIEVEVSIHEGVGRGIRISTNNKVVQAFSQAFEAVFETPCAFIFEGASIPIVAELTEACKGAPILLGLGLITDQIHAPNEHFGIDRLEKGMLIMAYAITLLQNSATND